MRYLVTGAGGFIGSCVTKKLLEAGGEVRCLVRNNVGDLKNCPVEICYGSLFDKESLKKALQGVDYVFNFAGQTRALKNRDYFRSNSDGFRILLETIKEEKITLKRVLQISSLAAVGPSRNGIPLTEDMPLKPVTPYGESKLQSEFVAKEFSSDIPITIIRPPVVYGQGDRSGLALFKSAAKGVELSIRGGDPHIMPIYVEDLADGCILLAHHPDTSGETFFLSGDEITTPHELFNILTQAKPNKRTIVVPRFLAWLVVYGLELKAQIVGKPNRLNSAKLIEIKYDWLVSNAKAKSFGFKPKTSLKDGFQTTFEWYKKAGWL